MKGKMKIRNVRRLLEQISEEEQILINLSDQVEAKLSTKTSVKFFTEDNPDVQEFPGISDNLVNLHLQSAEQINKLGLSNLFSRFVREIVFTNIPVGTTTPGITLLDRSEIRFATDNKTDRRMEIQGVHDLVRTWLHELGHVIDSETNIRQSEVWGESPFVADWLRVSSVREDIAESIAQFLLSPEKTRDIIPEKADVIEDII